MAHYQWDAVMVSWDRTVTGADNEAHLTHHPPTLFFHNSKQLHKLKKKCIAKQINNTDKKKPVLHNGAGGDMGSHTHTQRHTYMHRLINV